MSILYTEVSILSFGKVFPKAGNAILMGSVIKRALQLYSEVGTSELQIEILILNAPCSRVSKIGNFS